MSSANCKKGNIRWYSLGREKIIPDESSEMQEDLRATKKQIFGKSKLILTV